MVFWLILMMSGVLGSPETAAGGGFESMAREGRWEQILEVATKRSGQLPLRPEEALIAALAARVSGDPSAQAGFLELALDSHDLGPVAKIELAQLVVDDDPHRALDLVLGFIRRAPSRQLRQSAIEVVVSAVEAGADSTHLSAVERVLPSMSRSSRRPIELALALSSEPTDRTRLSALLSTSTRDLVALTAANELDAAGQLGVVDRWRVGKTFYRHALYERAIPILESLDDVHHRQIPRWEVAYLRGRCAFRRGRWDAAEAWYRTAISRTSAGERRAELEVHLGRTHELGGEMDDAVAAAQRAVRFKTTDDRRLFLARLRLRRDEPELARAGLARVRSRTARSRGVFMVGLYELVRGDAATARNELAGVSRNPWRGPAAVLAAELAGTADDPAGALALLVGAAADLDSYWASEARAITAQLPPAILDDWRRQEAGRLQDPVDRTRRLALARALKLEPDASRTTDLRAVAAAELDLQNQPEQPVFTQGLAARLWALGLETEAVRWDPSGLPRDTARSTWWTAEKELELGRPWLAISAADGAWRQATSRIPARGLPEGLRRALYPLPYPDSVKEAGSRFHVPWSLLAAVARAESRWNPDVLSKVGARGLMQLMPATAAAAGAANGHATVSPDDLFEPMISLDLGATELGRLLAVFGGNRAAAVAAYNAGEAQARLWLDQCGEECSEHRFVAQVSFSVTRGYTQEVLAATGAYEELYAESAAVTLTE